MGASRHHPRPGDTTVVTDRRLQAFPPGHELQDPHYFAEDGLCKLAAYSVDLGGTESGGRIGDGGRGIAASISATILSPSSLDKSSSTIRFIATPS